jgi:hypothetical protein
MSYFQGETTSLLESQSMRLPLHAQSSTKGGMGVTVTSRWNHARQQFDGELEQAIVLPY